MSEQLTQQLNKMRARANEVLDGMIRSREQVAKDCLTLCDTVERMNAVLAAQKAKEKATPGPGGLFDDIFKDIFKKP